jgi:very-short-patch-repair endonuclease
MNERINYELVKKHYETLTPVICYYGKLDPGGWIDPYVKEIPWTKFFSPIETNAWDDIRGYGRVPLYPQYPIAKYFVDFANPFLKIVIECDGKEFHRDRKKDIARDEDLKTLGWNVFRISGSDCKKIIYPDEYAENYKQQLENYYSSTIEGLLRALHLVIIDGPPIDIDDEEEEESAARWEEYNLAKKCLVNRSTTGWQK